MRPESTFLTVSTIAFGVDKLLEFVADRAAMESSRPVIPPCGGRAIHSVEAKQFDDGTAFELRICSKIPPPPGASSVNPVIQKLLEKLTAPSPNLLSKMNDLDIGLVWHFTEPIPDKLLFPSGDKPNPELDTFLQNAWGWILRVDVCEVCYPWIKAKRNRELVEIRSALDEHAQPRLILPEKDAASFREDFIALIAMFAAKAQCLCPEDNQLPEFFRSYCDRLFGSEREHRKLSRAEWYGVVDTVFRRLYCGIAGNGFTMPALAPSFRCYVAKAIQGEAANAAPRKWIPKPGRFPASIEDAANNLEVSHMTVRRCMNRLKFHEWTEETWTAVSTEIAPRKQWQELTAQLQKSGLKEGAARKQIQRWKRSGLTPDEARRRTLPSGRKGTCTACREENAPGEMFQGKFYCGKCYGEKTGHSSEV
jgi:hypothetical protein